MFKRFLKTEASLAPFVLRVLFAVVLFAHGAQKLFGWFGGVGFDASMEYLTESAQLPWLIAFLTILLEAIGSLLLLLGVGTRFLALSFALLGFGITVTTHLEHGFYMNWYGNQAGEGIEYFVFWIAIAIALTISGGGKYSIDSYISKNN